MRSRRDLVADFGRVYYSSRAYSKITWRGVQLLKYPTDLWIYGELLWRVRPEVVVETGTYAGGSTLFFADMLDLIGAGTVVTVDVTDWSEPDGYPHHPRITYLSGSSTDPAVVEQIRGVADGRTCLVILDSDHTAAHVGAELAAYGPLVSLGSYLIVEDTNVHDVRPDYPAGPDDALAKWLPDHPEFVVDRDCERLLLSAAPGGFLRRIR
jgi:cephalosporin hydroxylase